MGFFTIGNILTLGIVILILFLFRSLDKRSRILDKLRRHADKQKGDISAYVEELEAAIKNLGIELKVEQDSAKELMNRIHANNEQLAEKAAATDRIDERLNIYDNSLQELIRMTDRVQENLNRIRDESVFVDSVQKRVTEAKNGLASIENNLGSLEVRLRQENYEALKSSTQEVLAEVKSTVSDLSSQAETIERKVEDHREAVDKIEKHREKTLAHDLDIINRTLKTALEQASQRADRMEEAAFVKLKEQARERIEKIKTLEEDKIHTYQTNAKDRVLEIQNAIKTLREDWKKERHEWEAKDKALKDERRNEEKAFSDECKNNIQVFKVLKEEAANKISSDINAIEKRLEDLKANITNTISIQENLLAKAAEDMKQKALEVTASKLEEYREAQNTEFRQLESLAEESRKLDTELRRNMQETVSKVKNDFALFTEESSRDMEKTGKQFNTIMEKIKAGMAEIQDELSSLRSAAYDNTSEKLGEFEKDFYSDLEKRKAEMSMQISALEDDLEASLKETGEDLTEKQQALEQKLSDELRRELDERNAKIMGLLEKLNTDTGAFEESIREQMQAADITLAAYKEELDSSLEDSRKEALAAIKAEVSGLSLSASENVKLNQRDLEAKLKEINEYTENRFKEVQQILEKSRQQLGEQDTRIAAAREAVDEINREAEARRDEIILRTQEQAKTLEAGIEEAEQQIKGFFEQAKLIDEAGALKAEMERKIEDLRADLDKLDQRRLEAAQLENQFIKIRRLEDEVNARMARFLSDKHRIDQMDININKLLGTSKAVDEKLREVSDSDDLLQHVQVQIRKINESLAGIEEKYQRIEKKNQVLETTNEGIDQNFKDLQESEKALEKIKADLTRITDDISSLRNSIENLAGQSEKARETADQMVNLDTSILEIDERIQSMQKAREWIARAETRLEEVNREILENLKLLGAVQRDKKGKPVPGEEGAPSISTRENVIKLAQKGWRKDEIAKTLKLSISEVELILEIAPRD